MKNTKLRAIGLGFTSLLALPASAAIMYHDFGAFDESEASTGNITTHQLGTGVNTTLDTTVKNLINYADGSLTGVTFQITAGGRNMDGRNGGETSGPNAETPAAELFNVSGLNLDNGMIWTQGANNAMTITLSGLNSGLLYDLAFYGNRNVATDGPEQFTLGGAVSATNSSSTGIISSTVTQQDTRPNQAAGNVIRWTDINPGEDGEITFTMDTTWDEDKPNNIGYLNAMRLEAIPEPSTALLGGLGMLALLRRRR